MTADLHFAERDLYEEDHEDLRAVVRAFIASDVAPNFDRWESEHRIDRSFFSRAGELGLLVFDAPEEYGGSGMDDYRFSSLVIEEFARANFLSAGQTIALQNDVIAPYFLHFGSDEQKQRWVPGLVSGEVMGAIAMTEPSGGSDLASISTRAVREGDEWVISGSKTFISSGQNADVVIVVARTSDDRHRGLSLFLVEADRPGFSRGRNLDKIGLHGQDTSELFFDQVRVPASNLLGEEGRGFYHLMHNLPQERLSLAVCAVSACEGMLAETIEYVSGRTAFGATIGSFQHPRFVLAGLAAEVEMARVFVDDCIARHVRGELSAVRAAKAKLVSTDLQQRVATECLQLHGGYGFMREQSIARAFVDARIQTIYGGTNEIMREIISKDLGL